MPSNQAVFSLSFEPDQNTKTSLTGFSVRFWAGVIVLGQESSKIGKLMSRFLSEIQGCYHKFQSVNLVLGKLIIFKMDEIGVMV